MQKKPTTIMKFTRKQVVSLCLGASFVTLMFFTALFTNFITQENPTLTTSSKSSSIPQTSQLSQESRDYSTSPSPNSEGEITSNNRSIFWFIHITDTQSMWHDDDRTEWFRQFFNETCDILNPKMVVHTGDMVDSDYHGFFEPHIGQLESEWVTYAQILNETGRNASNYYEVLGNHDIYNDPSFTYFRNYSIQQKTNYDFTVELQSGTSSRSYHFLGLNTAEENGIQYPFHLFGMLSKEELDWYETQLSQNSDADLTIAFGHHPAYEVLKGGSEFFQLNKEYGVDLYLCGHGHETSYQMVDNRMISWETPKLSNTAESYRIITIDDNHIASTIHGKEEWPVGVITSPSDYHTLYEDITQNIRLDVSELRVLAWDIAGIQNLEWRFGKSENDEFSSTPSAWTIMNWEQDALYSTEFPEEIQQKLQDGNEYRIEVKISGNSGDRILSINYQASRPLILGWVYYKPIIIVMVMLLFIGLPALAFWLRVSGKRPMKTPQQRVDPHLRKYLLSKLAVWLLIPLIFGPIWMGEHTIVFSLFYIHNGSLLWYMVNTMISIITLLLGIWLPSSSLSQKNNKFGLIIITPISLAGVLVPLFLYTQIWGWKYLFFAPGYLMLLLCDILIVKHRLLLIQNRKMKK